MHVVSLAPMGSAHAGALTPEYMKMLDAYMKGKMREDASTRILAALCSAAGAGWMCRVTV